MNSFIPENPRAVVLVNDDGEIAATASNLGYDLMVQVVYSKASFEFLSQGLLFDSRRDTFPPQVLAHKKS